MKHKLFSYGTLQLPQVQLETYGRLLKGNSDKLFNYKLAQVEITDPLVLAKSKKQYHPIATKSMNPSDYIEGVLFQISEEELIQTDAYEVADYMRVLEKFESGKRAWIYIQKT